MSEEYAMPTDVDTTTHEHKQIVTIRDHVLVLSNIMIFTDIVTELLARIDKAKDASVIFNDSEHLIAIKAAIASLRRDTADRMIAVNPNYMRLAYYTKHIENATVVKDFCYKVCSDMIYNIGGDRITLEVKVFSLVNFLALLVQRSACHVHWMYYKTDAHWICQKVMMLNDLIKRYADSVEHDFCALLRISQDNENLNSEVYAQVDTADDKFSTFLSASRYCIHNEKIQSAYSKRMSDDEIKRYLLSKVDFSKMTEEAISSLTSFTAVPVLS